MLLYLATVLADALAFALDELPALLGLEPREIPMPTATMTRATTPRPTSTLRTR